MISVVIPLYNKEASIAHTLECVLAQTYQDFEIIVVDDGSKDSSAAIVEQFTDTRIRLIHQENGGVSKARNTGIENAGGEYVAFLDADDEWLPEHLANIVSLMRVYAQSKAFATRYVTSLNGKESAIILNKMPFSEKKGLLTNYFEICSCSHPPVCSSAVCVEKRLLEEIGGFPVGLTSGEDLLTWARIALKTDWAYSMTPTAIYLMGEGYDYSNKPPRRQDEGDPVGKALKKLFKQYPDTIGYKDYLSRWHKMRASVAIRYFERSETLKEAFLAFGYAPFKTENYPFFILPFLPRFVLKKIFGMKNLRTHK